MCNTLKMADRRAKQTKIWDLGYYSAHRLGRVVLMPNSMNLVWDHLVHFTHFPILWFSKRYSFKQFSSDFNHTSYKYHNQGLILIYYFFGDQFLSYFNQTSYTVSKSGANIGYYFFGGLTKIKHVMTLWNFNLGVNGKILECTISWKWLIVFPINL